MNKPKQISRPMIVFFGGVIGLLVCLLFFMVATVLATAFAVVDGQSAEGGFWGAMVSVFLCPAGGVIGLVTAIASSKDRAWFIPTIFGSVAAAIGTFFLWVFLAYVLNQPNFGVTVLALVVGVLTAAAVAFCTKAMYARNSG